ncbi:MAG: IS110 family transposase [Desulfobacterales bacterium]|nr:IS110 family transposase [Desulfobacterales bacterium]
MKFYTKQHHYYCGIDLHARKMYICIIDQQGSVKIHKNIKTDPDTFLELVAAFTDDLVVGVECVFCWYWLADLCHKHNITFVLGHALYMKAIHGGKTKNDKIDSYKLASLFKGGNFPIAYTYPAKMRATRDLLRRRMYISRRCSELVAHIQNTNTQYNLPVFRKKLSRKYNHEGVVERFEDPEVRKTIEVDLAMINSLNQILTKLEWHIEKIARQHDYLALYLLRSIPGVGQILALVILYEVHDVKRFPRVQDFSSYARLIRPVKESNGKWAGHSNKKIGNHHLKWAIKEASILMLRDSSQAKAYVAKLERKYNKGKALGIFAHKLGRAIYFMLKNKEAFDMKRFFDQ